tara:strand:+ start:431 stop:652 length:222 start_codon:yes stop_codon:yes gene_type:complete
LLRLFLIGGNLIIEKLDLKQVSSLFDDLLDEFFELEIDASIMAVQHPCRLSDRATYHSIQYTTLSCGPSEFQR